MDVTSGKGCTVVIDAVEGKSAYEKLRDERVAELAMRLEPVKAAAQEL
jgi:hypothetical protein